MIFDKIITSPDDESETVSFVDRTPSQAYETLTDAVSSVKYNDNYVRLKLDEIPQSTIIGKVMYDEEEDRVINIGIDEAYLEDYGVEK